MPIVLMRVDNRFVHAQMLEGWLPTLRPDALVIANDELAQDESRKIVMRTALTYPSDLTIDTVEEIASLLTRNDSRALRSVVVVEHPDDALRLKESGVPFDRLILGNIGAKSDPLTINERVSLGAPARRALRAISQAGVSIFVQGVPSDEPLPLNRICECLGTPLGQ